MVLGHVLEGDTTGRDGVRLVGRPHLGDPKVLGQDRVSRVDGCGVETSQGTEDRDLDEYRDLVTLAETSAVTVVLAFSQTGQFSGSSAW